MKLLLSLCLFGVAFVSAKSTAATTEDPAPANETEFAGAAQGTAEGGKKQYPFRDLPADVLRGG